MVHNADKHKRGSGAGSCGRGARGETRSGALSPLKGLIAVLPVLQYGGKHGENYEFSLTQGRSLVKLEA